MGIRFEAVIVTLVFTGHFLAITSCRDSNAGINSPGDETKLAELLLDVRIGEDPTAPEEYQFSFIRRMVETEDGTLWVQDAVTRSPLLRRFGPDGMYKGQVGQVGSGPGEYRLPEGMALTRDGRVALRDRELLRRITFYDTDGKVDTTWMIGAPNPFGGSLFIDTAGVAWLSIDSRPGPNRPPNFFLRLRPDGGVLDSVSEPLVPETAAGSVVSGVRVPFTPRDTWAWSPEGTFAVARTDRYRVEILPPPGPAQASQRLSRVITRGLPLVPISEEERAAVRGQLLEDLAGREGIRGTGVPEIPQFKPPIKSLRYSQDGRLLVEVSQPSRLAEGEWSEPTAFDVFDRGGSFLGRFILPDFFSLRLVKGDHLWGVFQGAYGVESIRRYRIVWP